MKEITIAGGGLSGLSLGIALRERGVPVTILEAGGYPRHRVCGEFVCGVSDETLDALGISEMRSLCRRNQESIWVHQQRTILKRKLPRIAWSLSRYEMDDWLQARFVKKGGSLKTHTRAKKEPRPGFVWAAGRCPSKHSPWIGLKCHLHYQLTSELEMHLGEGGYVGLVEVEDGWVNICGLFKKNTLLKGRGVELMMTYLREIGLNKLADQLQIAEVRPGSFSAVAGFELGQQKEMSDLLVLGDAESMIPPFTGNGMSMAFEAAEQCIDPLVSYAKDGSAWDEVRAEVKLRLNQKFKTRLKTAGLCHPLLLSPTGQNALAGLSAARLLPFQTLFALSH